MSIINKRGSEFSMYEKAKPRGDNLSIPKYNRMNSSSIYQVEFDAPMKLPQITANKKIEIRRSSTQKYKISKIFWNKFDPLLNNSVIHCAGGCQVDTIL